MHASLLTLLLVACGIWIGAIVFQSAVVAPATFSVLDEPAARGFLRTLFPKFFRLGLFCGATMLLALIAAGIAGGWDAPLPWLAGIVASMTGLNAASLAIVPAINDARDLGPAGSNRFRVLHRLSVIMTVFVLLLGIGVFTILAHSVVLAAGAG